jgi:hypothetical protein
MKQIWKFEIELVEDQELHVPGILRPLSVQMQGETLCLWGVVEPGKPNVVRHVRVVGTGHPFPDETECEHIDTVQVDGFVWHVFLK